MNRVMRTCPKHPLHFKEVVEHVEIKDVIFFLDSHRHLACLVKCLKNIYRKLFWQQKIDSRMAEP